MKSRNSLCYNDLHAFKCRTTVPSRRTIPSLDSARGSEGLLKLTFLKSRNCGSLVLEVFTRQLREPDSKQAWLRIFALPLHRDMLLERYPPANGLSRGFGQEGWLWHRFGGGGWYPWLGGVKGFCPPPNAGGDGFLGGGMLLPFTRRRFLDGLGVFECLDPFGQLGRRGLARVGLQLGRG